MNTAAIIPAAGVGSRAGFAKNKILQKAGGVSVVARAVAAFAQNAGISRIVVCVNEADREDIARELSGFDAAPAAGGKPLILAPGGATRTESVKNALEALAALPCPPDYVLIHDAARPFVSQKVIHDCIDTVRQFGSAVCALPCTDTAVRAESGFAAARVERENLYTLQTPQGFAFAPLYGAYRKLGEGDVFTDDSGVYAKYVGPPRLFAGERRNVKLTFAEDFAMDEIRTGVGVDTHAFVRPKARPLGAQAAPGPAPAKTAAAAGKTSRDQTAATPDARETGAHIVLGGVRIPSAFPLAAHSDGDVLCHAVMDALLSAAGLSDIGHHFPDTDPQYRGADSLALLAKVRALLEGEGFAAGNVSAAIVAEAPRLAPYIGQMKQNIAHVLQISERAVGISAGTNEGLGYLGRGEGVTVVANVTVRRI